LDSTVDFMLRRTFSALARSDSRYTATQLFTKTNYLALKARQARNLAALATTSNAMREQKNELDERAARYPDRFTHGVLAYLLAQNAVLFHWTYQRFDWNLVEPITYLLGYSVVWLCTAVYFANGKEFTYDNVRTQLQERRQQALYTQADFDVNKFRQIEIRRNQLETMLDRDRM
jgi:hypothetical protein